MSDLKDKLAKLYKERDYNDSLGLDDYDLNHEIIRLRQQIASMESGRKHEEHN